MELRGPFRRVAGSLIAQHKQAPKWSTASIAICRFLGRPVDPNLGGNFLYHNFQTRWCERIRWSDEIVHEVKMNSTSLFIRTISSSCLRPARLWNCSGPLGALWLMLCRLMFPTFGRKTFGLTCIQNVLQKWFTQVSLDRIGPFRDTT